MTEQIQIITRRFLLKSLQTSDVTERYLSWLNDSASKKYIDAASSTKNLDQLKLYVREKIVKADVVFLGIFERLSGIHIGNIKYDPVDSKEGYAIMGILIGDGSYRGKGVAVEVMTASSQWLQERCGINRILLGVSIENVAAIRAYEKAGYVLSSTQYIKGRPRHVSMVLRLNDRRIS